MDGTFAGVYSTNNIWRDEEESRCLTLDLDDIESDIASLETGKADTNHTHTGYAVSTHTHSYNDLNDLPTIPTSLPANGGNADTVDNKHASDFATSSDIQALQTLVGDTSVSSQISSALTSKANISHTHVVNDVTGLSDALSAKYEKPSTGIVKTDLASDVQASLNKADTAIQSLSGYATESYVDTKVADIVDAAPEALNTLNELAAALGDNPNFATTVATQIGGKVDKVDGKGLSSNDYTSVEKTKLAGIEDGANKTIVDSSLSATSTNPVQNKVVNEAISNLNTLVGDTAVSSQISSAIANKADADHTHSSATTTAAGFMSAADKSKLDGIAAGADNTTLSSLGITATATELNYVDGVTSNIQTQLNSKAASNHTHNIIGYYGSDTADTNGWYKVCAVSQSGYSDNNLNLLLTQGFSKQAVGHLYIHTRCDNGTAISVPSFKWLYRYGFSVGDAIIVTGNNTWTLYIQQTIARYGRIQVQVISKSDTSGDLSFSLSNNTTPEATTPTATITASDGATVNAANKLSTARTIRTNLASTSTASFDGSANITPGVTGTLPIANGGTGATTVAGALTNLGNIGSSYISNPANVSVARVTWKTIASITLSAGTYVIIGNHQWGLSSAGTVYVDRIRDESNTYCTIRNFMNGGGGTTTSAIIVLTASTTIIYDTYHEHTAAATASGIHLSAVKIK